MAVCPESSASIHPRAPRIAQSSAPLEHSHPPEAPALFAHQGCCPEWDRPLPEKQLEGGEREGQETGLTGGRGRPAARSGAVRGACLSWVVADGEACWGRRAPLGAGSCAHRLSTNQEHMWAPGSCGKHVCSQQGPPELQTDYVQARLAAGYPTTLGHLLTPGVCTSFHLDALPASCPYSWPDDLLLPFFFGGGGLN